MPRKWGDDAVAGSFEELPALLVVLVAVSLFSVSVAHSAATWASNDDYCSLLQDCQAFAGMVRESDTLAAGHSGTYDYCKLANLSAADFLEEFNSTMLGFEYQVTVQCVDVSTGNISLNVEILSSELPSRYANIARHHTCVNVDNRGSIGAARLTVSIWGAVA
ncbi:MAG: hypothetical protein R6W91_04290 [Thermoplasmata archaeon]